VSTAQNGAKNTTALRSSYKCLQGAPIGDCFLLAHPVHACYRNHVVHAVETNSSQINETVHSHHHKTRLKWSELTISVELAANVSVLKMSILWQPF